MNLFRGVRQEPVVSYCHSAFLITKKLKDDKQDETRGFTWKFAAMVIDRLCMIIFAIATIISTLAILLSSKNFFKDSIPDPRF